MKKISIAIMVLVVALASCKKTPEVNLKYVDVERDLITVGTTTATVQCDYQYPATLKKAYFYYGEGQNEADMNTAEMRVVLKKLYVDLAGLKENTTYSYYYEFHNGFNSMRTALKTFETEAGNGGGEEPPTPPEIMLPTVITASVTEITSNSAKGGGEVTNDGGGEVTERGICWSTNANPTLNDSHIAIGTGIGEFVATVSGLDENTTYHIRAYAINEKGAAYCLEEEFITLSCGGGSGDVPIGALNGLFTINENGDQVYFSQGDLQYIGNTQTWRFAENQWDYIGTSQANNSQNTTRDLFGWGTSGWDNGNVYFHPWDTQRYGYSYQGNGYGPTDGSCYAYDITGIYANADWGVYNSISNGGNQVNIWRTLTEDEWIYVFNTRNTVSGIRYAKCIIYGELPISLYGVNGLILLPDDWSTNTYNLNSTNNGYASFSSNTITTSDWAVLEQFGAVFLPAAGWRDWYNNAPVVRNQGQMGFYWTASHRSESCNNSEGAFGFYFDDSHLDVENSSGRAAGFSVRLVHDASK